MAKHATPLLDQLETGPWPSFVSDMKQQAEVRAKNEANVEFQIPQDVVEDLLGILELSFEDGTTHWKHGGIVGVFGYGGGVIGRYCDQPEKFPGVAHFHTMRVNQPGGKFYTSEYLRSFATCGISAAAVSPICTAPPGTSFSWAPPPPAGRNFLRVDPQHNQDLGGSGSNLRTPADCMGSARCEYACYDTQDLCYTLTQEYQDELHRPAFPYKFKFKFDGCPNCCVASIARADMSLHRHLERRHQDRPGSGSGLHQRRISAQWRRPLRPRLGSLSTSRRKSSISAPPNACGWKTAN
jgi:sulfite reductase alpha subunit